MNIQTKMKGGDASDEARAAPPAGRSLRAVSGTAGITIAQDVNLTAIMRREGIVNIHWDRLLDRFDVTLADWRVGGGATVGDGLANAKRRPS